MEPVKIELIPVSIVCRVKNTGGIIEIPVTDENKPLVANCAVAIWESLRELPKSPSGQTE